MTSTPLGTPALSKSTGFSRRSLGIIVGAAFFCLLLGWLSYYIFYGIYIDNERRLAAQHLDAFALSFEGALARPEAFPALLALHPTLAAALREPKKIERIAAANAYLEAAQQSADVAAAFLLNRDGRTLAASNWRLPRSFVGHNYAFRPYFQEAISNGFGRFYGVGITTGEPGYFLAAPIRGNADILGVIVLKVDLEALEHALPHADDTLLLADADGIIFLSSAHQLRYRALAPLSPQVLAELRQTQRYGNQPIRLLADQPLRVGERMPVRLALPGEAPRKRLIHGRPVGNLGWQVVQLGDLGEAPTAALAAAIAVTFAAAFCIGVILHLRRRQQRREELDRIYAELETHISDRTTDLRNKITALERTESILRQTRDSAVQAGKLAVLGQMSVSINHELNQPLTALQTSADNALTLLKRAQYSALTKTLEFISDLAHRMGHIIHQLKIFARNESATACPVLLSSAIDHALLIIEPRRRELNTEIKVTPLTPDFQVIAEARRLEQVLINLLRNGLDAMAHQPQAQLEISAQHHGETISLQIKDQGPGIAEDVLEHLFEPFYTTKPAGEGLGLGLSISLAIVESYQGSLSAYNAAEGGAVFVLTLPAAEASSRKN